MKKLKVIASAMAMMTAMGASAFAACEPTVAATSATSFDYSMFNKYFPSINGGSTSTPSVDTASDIVTNVSATAYLDKKVIWTSWNGVENAQRYQLEFSRSITDWENAYRIRTNNTDESYRLKVSSPKGIINLDETTTYYVRVRAQVDGEYKNWSIPVKITVEEEMPEAMASLESALDALGNVGR